MKCPLLELLIILWITIHTLITNHKLIPVPARSFPVIVQHHTTTTFTFQSAIILEQPLLEVTACTTIMNTVLYLNRGPMSTIIATDSKRLSTFMTDQVEVFRLRRVRICGVKLASDDTSGCVLVKFVSDWKLGTVKNELVITLIMNGT